MSKKPFVTKEQVEEIVKTYPTPFHLYDEKGIRANAKALKEAFSWNPGYKEYFAVKATPNPFLLDILKEYGCGSIWMISAILSSLKVQSDIFLRRSVAVTIQADYLKSAMISWTIREMPNMV